MDFFNKITSFWRFYPALLYSLSSLLGYYLVFYKNFFLLFPLLALWLPFILNIVKGYYAYLKPLTLSILVFLVSALYCMFHYQFPSLPTEGIKGTAYVSIESFTSQTTFFGKNWLYRCQLKNFIPKEETSSIARNIKCTISIPQKQGWLRPQANQDYILDGTLMKSENGNYILRIQGKSSWKSVDGSWSLAEWRYKAKKKAIEWIRFQIPHLRTSTFLSGLVTGEFDDRIMQMEFARFGLQHIMAISGFHFAIVAGILNFLLRPWVSGKVGAYIVIILLSIYFFFLGGSSSIFRAWVMISLGLFGFCIQRQGNALNSMGVALFVVLLVDPLLSQTMGFQFSFLATAAILMGYMPIDYLLSQFLLKRPLSHMIGMNGWNQHAYLLLSFFRQGVSLTIAVNLFATPVLLYYFHQFPLMSLFYNLFFPFFVSISMFLLLMGLITFFVLPPIGQFINYLNDNYTNWVLNLTYNLPSSVDIYYEIDFVTMDILIIYLSLLFLGAMWMKLKMIDKHLEHRDLTFV